MLQKLILISFNERAGMVEEKINTVDTYTDLERGVQRLIVVYVIQAINVTYIFACLGTNNNMYKNITRASEKQ